ncbi:MAG: hypothetical protein HGB17_06430 [Syntrophobacteraceae bacterium]|nr:hypothetical protein [Syntrophobacteraceae bacterium]
MKEEEIEIFTFFGKEMMKGLRLEKMDDILHDFKNPAIATAGFAKRVKKILGDGEYLVKKDKVDQALDIILKETSRIQELALTLHGEGREETIDLTEKLKRRFLINEEAIRELKRENIHFFEGELASPLWIRCFPLHIERVLDNLLNNAFNAIPEEGGELCIRSYRRDGWAIAEITNTGKIREEDRDRLLMGDGKGRGIHITTRLVKQMGGKMEVESEEYQTTFRVMLPLAGPATVLAVLLVFLGAWSDYLLSLIMINDVQKFTIQLRIAQFLNAYGIDHMPRYSAAAIIAAAPTVLLYLIGHRWILRGTLAGRDCRTDPSSHCNGEKNCDIKPLRREYVQHRIAGVVDHRGNRAHRLSHGDWHRASKEPPSAGVQEILERKRHR